MATAQLGAGLRHIRNLAADPKMSEQTDGTLLRAFLSRNDQAAFEALLQRHGPMVLRVCRRTLGHVHDADDAFQATFLILAQQAAVGIAVNASGEDHVPARAEPGQPPQPGQPIFLHGTLPIADKNYIYISYFFQVGSVTGEVVLFQAEQIGGSRLGDALLVQALDGGQIGQHTLAAAQAAAQPVELKLGVGGEADQGHRSGPQPGGHRLVGQVEHDQVGTPALGQAATQRLPVVGGAQRRAGPEWEAGGGDNRLGQIVLDEAPVRLAKGTERRAPTAVLAQVPGKVRVKSPVPPCPLSAPGSN